MASFLMVFSLIIPGFVSAESNNKVSHAVNDAHLTAEEKISKRLLNEFDDNEKVTFLVKFKEKSDLEKVVKEFKAKAKTKKLSSQESKFQQRSVVLSDLKSVSLESQQKVVAFLENETKNGNVTDFQSFHIVNGLSVTATKKVAEKIATFAEVEKLLPNEERQLQEATKTEDVAPQSTNKDVEWNVAHVHAPEAWRLGIDGTGTVVASIDSGVQWDHPALKEKYRGYDAETDSVDHQYSFFDASDGVEVAFDDNGHGTHVTGTMVGGEPDGSNQIGVAPGAKWIAVKGFNVFGSTNDAILLNAAEWILAPGGRVDMAPDVVNNSWGGGSGLDEWYRDAVRAWRAAEIFPAFSAGNTTMHNPGGPGSIAVPANYPESFATAAIDINNQVPSFSLRGPSPYEGVVKPDITGPGVNIRSSVPGSDYEGGWNGTSMSGPAVAAVAAMLRQVDADMPIDIMEQVLLNTTTPLTDTQYPTSPNDGYGYGLVDAFVAVNSVLNGLGTVEGRVSETEEGSETELTGLPLRAQVSVLDSGRSVFSNPEDGSYLLSLSVGDFTIEAGAYGYRPAQKKVTIKDKGVTTANFELEKLQQGAVTGQIRDRATGDIVSEATILLIEDANTLPVKTDANGNYSITAYEGTYTLKVIAPNYHSKEIEVTIGKDPIELDLALKPRYTYPGGEIGYDDGTPENANSFYDPGYGWGVRMSLAEGQESAVVTDGVFRFWNAEWPNPGGTAFAVEVWDVAEDGQPGRKIAGPIDGTAKRDDTWTVVDLRKHNIIVDGDFYMVYIQTQPMPLAPGLAVDHDGDFSGRGYEYNIDTDGGFWMESDSEDGNYMIRSRVAYDIHEPVITSPEAGAFTNESAITVKGTGTPTTTIQLTNNGEEVGTAEIGDDGAFAISTDLTEGENLFTAITTLDGEVTEKSSPVIVTLDTINPELTIDSPEDKAITNRKTVTVTGAVSDMNLDYVAVNGGRAIVKDGNYTKQIILEDGENEIAVIAYDKAGNTKTKAITITADHTAPVIEKLQPSTDLSVKPGDQVKVSFQSDTEGGNASFTIQHPSQNGLQSSTKLAMDEVTPGNYEATWIAPDKSIEGAVVVVELTDIAGNSTTQEAVGKLTIVPEKAAGSVDRISGSDRFQTAIEIGQEGWKSANTVVLARGDDYADALAGVPLAYKLDAPVLLAGNDRIFGETLKEIERLGASKVIILGGTNAVSETISTQLEEKGYKVKRVAGNDRDETAALIASEVAPKGAEKVVVANGMDFPDALSVASHAAKQGLPILLTGTNKLSEATKTAIDSLGVKETIVIGGTSVVSESIFKKLPDATRLAGKDRYDTNIAVANHFEVESKHVYVATGKLYADALTGSVLAAKNDSAIVLVHDAVPEVASTYIKGEKIEHITIFGGTNSVNNKVANDLKKMIQ